MKLFKLQVESFQASKQVTLEPQKTFFPLLLSHLRITEVHTYGSLLLILKAYLELLISPY